MAQTDNWWLYVESSPADAELVRQVLNEHCPDVELAVASNFEDTFLYLSARKGSHVNPVAPRLILIDPSFPRKDGIEVLRQIRRASSAPVIVFSDQEDPQIIQHYYEAGATSYVVKPTGLDELVATLTNIAKFWCYVVVASGGTH